MIYFHLILVNVIFQFFLLINFFSSLNKFSFELHQVTLSVCPLSSGPPLTTLYSHSSPYSPGHLTCAAGNTAHCTGNNNPSCHIYAAFKIWCHLCKPPLMDGVINSLGQRTNLCVSCSWPQERRLLCISTNDFKVWHVSEYGKVLMDETSHSHLYTGDTYVVRWYYLVTATGRTLKVSSTFVYIA